MVKRIDSWPLAGKDCIIPAAAIAAGLSGSPAWSAPGDLDPSFGDVGRASLPSYLFGAVWSLQANANDYDYAGGDNCYYYWGYYCGDDGYIDDAGKISNEGDWDPARATSLPGNFEIQAVAWQADGKLVGAGYSYSPAAQQVFRLDASGALDTTFGTGGYVTLGSQRSVVSSVIVDDGGRILVAQHGANGLTLTRLLSSGQTDPAFGLAGTANPDPVSKQGVRGSLLQAAGGAYRALGVADWGECRLVGSTASGVADPDLGGQGYVRVDAPDGVTLRCAALAALPDGHVLVGGTATDTGAIVRLSSSGIPDPVFASDVGGFLGSVDALAVDGAGNVYAAGPDATEAADPVVSRLLAAGQVDVGFGDQGRALVDPGGEYGEVASITRILASRPGEVMVGGQLQNGSSVRRPFLVRMTTTGSGPGVMGFRTRTVEVDESAGTARVVVRRTGGSSGAVSVGYRAMPVASDANPSVPGIDFTAVQGRLEWADGDRSDKSISVPILVDTLPFESPENVLVTLEQPEGGGRGRWSSLVTIRGDDYPHGGISVRPAAARVSEINSAQFIVSRNDYAEGAVSVTVEPISGSARIGEDVFASAQTLSWPDGDFSIRTVTYSIKRDGKREPDETFKVRLTNPTGGAVLTPESEAEITISSRDSNSSGGSGGGALGPFALLWLGFAAVLRSLRRAADRKRVQGLA